MKLENQDLIDQLETEKMIHTQSLRQAVALIETLALDGHIPVSYGAITSQVLDACWTSLTWVKQWDELQQSEARLDALGERMKAAKLAEQARAAAEKRGAA
jgi:hypothetical protein